MAKEVVNAIRRAEMEAADQEAEAKRKAEELIQTAYKDAHSLKMRRKENFLREEKDARRNAEDSCKKMLDDADKKGEAAIKELEAAAVKRRKQAVDAVLSALFGSAQEPCS